MAVNEHRPTVADVKFQVKEGSSISSATFIFGDEDHTLGNALRHVLMENKEVDFCGYSVPHPRASRPTKLIAPLLLSRAVFPCDWASSGRPALELLKEGLRDLRELCSILEERVEQEIPDADGDD
ncbi:unnamed protein product [Scytosiphon promiscuus]